MIDREPLQGVPTGAHEPGVASLDTAHLFQCQLSMPKALLCPSERAKLSIEQPAYGECRLSCPKISRVADIAAEENGYADY
jgi:hypothetical protein